jgi:hypothetical protein
MYQLCGLRSHQISFLPIILVESSEEHLYTQRCEHAGQDVECQWSGWEGSTQRAWRLWNCWNDGTPLSWAISIHSIPSCLYKVRFNIVHPPTSWSSQWSLSFWLATRYLYDCFCFPVSIEQDTYSIYSSCMYICRYVYLYVYNEIRRLTNN